MLLNKSKKSGAIIVNVGDNLSRSIAELKRRVMREGKIFDMKLRRTFVSPSEKRKKEKIEARKKIRRSQKDAMRGKF